MPVAATAAQVTFTAVAATLTPGETIVIEGHVTDAQNDPLYATIKLRVSHGQLAQERVTTLSDGSFHVVYTAPRVPGDATLTAEVYGTTPVLRGTLALHIAG